MPGATLATCRRMEDASAALALTLPKAHTTLAMPRDVCASWRSSLKRATSCWKLCSRVFTLSCLRRSRVASSGSTFLFFILFSGNMNECPQGDIELLKVLAVLRHAASAQKLSLCIHTNNFRSLETGASTSWLPPATRFSNSFASWLPPATRFSPASAARSPLSALSHLFPELFQLQQRSQRLSLRGDGIRDCAAH